MKKTLVIFGLIAVVAVAGYFAFSLAGSQQSASQIPVSASLKDSVSPSPAATQTSGNQNTVTINLDAQRWQYTPGVITVKKGQTVHININNTDALHGIKIPDFNVEGDTSVDFTATKTGEFAFYCRDYCGSGHADMQGKIIVTN